MARRPPSLLRRLLRWSLWLALGAALALQLRILTQGGLRVPDFAIAAATRRLAAHGLSFRATAIWLDPRGRVLVIQPRVGLATSADSPIEFASAHALALQLRRRELLRGELAVTRVEITGLGLALPAPYSPSGTDQPLLEGGELRLSRPPGSSAWRLDQSSARVLEIPTAFTGALPAFSPAETPRAAPEAAVRSALRRAADVYRRLADLPLDTVRCLRIDLAPGHLTVSAELPAIRVPDHPVIPDVLVGSTLDEIRLVATLPFADPDAAEVRLDAARLAAPPALALSSGRVALRLRAPARAALEADLAVASIQKTDTTLPPVPLVGSGRYSGGRLDARASLRLADAPWSLLVAGSPVARSGELSAAGEITPAVLELVRPYLPEKARPILSLADPVALDLSALLAPGGAPSRVEARARAGRAVAHHVRFDRAAANLVFEPGAHHLRADNLLLVQDDSAARGSYEMDTESLAFRFLLGGRLRPMAIEGWFSGWWDNLWKDFAFGPVPPAAEVDVQGVWKQPRRTTVFVGASSGEMTLRALPLDSLFTQVWITGDLVDIRDFRAADGPFGASGRFSRRLAPDFSAWERMDFDLHSDFPIDALPKLFPKEGAALVAPFALTAPPVVHLVGEVFGPGAAPELAGKQHYDLELSTAAPLRYQGFPLDHLALRLERRDTDLMLHDIRAGFASDTATGRAVLSGPATDRWLAFDLALPDADLDLVLARWREFQATRPATPSPAAAPSAARDADDDKPLGGRVSLTVAATGPLADPLAYAGNGTARIVGADLARIRLLGGFSSLLSSLGIGLATVELTEADAEFRIDRDRLDFSRLHLTGPSALVEAKGGYTLPGGTLDFSAKVRPFEKSSGFLGSAAGFVLSPLSSALEVELQGPLQDPEWTFSYGPTRFFRRITGSRPKPDPAPSPAPPANPSPAAQ